tara:strand:- start:21 stop:377 length:357 start_codon:yes stop_codon:yes gene_type:complete
MARYKNAEGMARYKNAQGWVIVDGVHCCYCHLAQEFCPRHGVYEIQTCGRYSEWTNDIGDDNEFATTADALAMIKELKTLGEDWAAAEYRVVPKEEVKPYPPRTHCDHRGRASGEWRW